MNRYRALIAGAWALAALGALASIAAWATAVPSVPREGRKAYASTGSPTRQDTVGLASMAATIRDRDPFRSDRKPANVTLKITFSVRPEISVDAVRMGP